MYESDIHVFIFCLIIFSQYSLNSKEYDRKFTMREFEGKIVYTIEIKSKSENISSYDLQNMFGDTMKQYFKNGNFRMIYNGNRIKDVWILKNKNKEYDYIKEIDSLFVVFLSRENKKIKKIYRYENILEILNRKCNLLVIETKESNSYFWYDPNIFLSPDQYKKMKFGFRNVYFKESKSPWLKYMYEGEVFSITYTATAIHEEIVDSKLFELPDLPKTRYP